MSLRRVTDSYSAIRKNLVRTGDARITSPCAAAARGDTVCWLGAQIGCEVRENQNKLEFLPSKRVKLDIMHSSFSLVKFSLVAVKADLLFRVLSLVWGKEDRHATRAGTM